MIFETYDFNSLQTELIEKMYKKTCKKQPNEQELTSRRIKIN